MDELRTMEKEEKTTLSNGQTNQRLTSYYYKTLSDYVGGANDGRIGYLSTGCSDMCLLTALVGIEAHVSKTFF